MPQTFPLAALLRRLAADADTVPDADLLDRFVRASDQAAFELLVWRHGGLVWNVCQRMLAPDRDAAEDACQATFFALAKHAGRMRDRDALPGWLHRVAVRAALDLIASRRGFNPRPMHHLDRPDPRPGPQCAAANREVRSLLDAGINSLPDRFRVPFVLCELEGMSNREAAAVLDCPVGTVESRLTRARHRLRDWLSERGVSPSIAGAAAVPESVRAAMIRVAMPGSILGPMVRTLADRAVRSAVGVKLAASVAVGLMLAISATGFALMPAGPPPGKPEEAKPVAGRRVDADGVALPDGAVARLGSPRLRHGSWVKDVCFSPDGKQLASVGYDNVLRLWDATTGKSLLVHRREAGEFDRVSFAPGGQMVIVAGRNAGKKCDLSGIDATTGLMLARMQVEAAMPEAPAIRFNADGSRLALGVADTKELLVIDTSTGRTVWKAATGADTPGGVAFSADGIAVAVSTSAGRVLLFDRDGKATGVLQAERAAFTQVAIRPDGAAVLAYDKGAGTLIAWDRPWGKPRWRQSVAADYSLVYSPDGKTLVRSAYAYTAGTIDPEDGGSPGIGGKKLATFESMVEATCAAFRPDGKVVALGTIAGPICLYEPESGKPVTPSANPPYEVRWLRFSPDGKTLYGWAADWFAWDRKTGKQTRVTNTGWNYGVPLSPDGRLTAQSVWYSGAIPRGSKDDGSRFEVRDAKTGAIVHSSPGAKFRRTGWIDFTPDGKGVVCASHDDSILAWEIATGKELVRMTGHHGSARYRAFSADGRVLVTATLNNPLEEFSVRVWELKTGKQLAKLNPGVGVVGVAASSDGRRVAALGYTNAAGKPDPRHRTTVWDVASGKVLATVPQGGDGGHIALSPDGRLVAVSARWKNEVRVFEVASAGERFVFRHDGEVTGLAFAPDGRTLAAASKDAPVFVWDVAGVLAGNAEFADRVWEDLAGKPEQAFAAIRGVRTHPAKALPMLRERTKLPTSPGAKVVEKLLADLDADDLATRKKATTFLASYGETIRAALEVAHKGGGSPEVRKRLVELLRRLDGMSAERVRVMRVVEAVEGMDSIEARALLESWAGGSSGAILANEAKAALARQRR